MIEIEFGYDIRRLSIEVMTDGSMTFYKLRKWMRRPAIWFPFLVRFYLRKVESISIEEFDTFVKFMKEKVVFP